jgi:uncharacterized SAM-binding protein YcdF (DUF218 family)
MPCFLKRFLGQFLMPLPLVTALFLLGWCLGRVKSQRRAGWLLCLFSGLLFLAFGCGLWNPALARLERRHPPFDPAPEECARLRGSDIVVLGQGLAPRSDLPLRFCDNDIFRARMMEAARLARRIPESRLLISMAGPASPAEKRAALDEYAFLFGLARERLVMFAGARDTAEETRAALALARTNAPLVLVTSAAHMPRALRLCAPRPGGVVPAPCDYAVVEDEAAFSSLRLSLPAARNWLNAERLCHEKLGALHERWFGRWQPPRRTKRPPAGDTPLSAPRPAP